MKRLLLIAATAFVICVPSAAGVESTIYPGVGIAKIRLGMSPTQVKKALGKWSYSTTDGNRVTVGWGFATWTVVFVAGKTVEVDTTSHAQKTTTGVGPGSPWHALARAYPHGVCVLDFKPASTHAELLVPHKGGTQTIYYAVGPNNENKTIPWTLNEVHVRTPWTPLPEFVDAAAAKRAGGHALYCKSTWRTGSPV